MWDVNMPAQPFRVHISWYNGSTIPLAKFSFEASCFV